MSEYLILDPLERYAQRYLLGANRLYGAPEIFAVVETLTLASLPELDIPLWEIFNEPALAKHRAPRFRMNSSLFAVSFPKMENPDNPIRKPLNQRRNTTQTVSTET